MKLLISTSCSKNFLYDGIPQKNISHEGTRKGIDPLNACQRHCEKLVVLYTERLSAGLQSLVLWMVYTVLNLSPLNSSVVAVRLVAPAEIELVHVNIVGVIL